MKAKKKSEKIAATTSKLIAAVHAISSGDSFHLKFEDKKYSFKTNFKLVYEKNAGVDDDGDDSLFSHCILHARICYWIWNTRIKTS